MCDGFLVACFAIYVQFGLKNLHLARTKLVGSGEMIIKFINFGFFEHKMRKFNFVSWNDISNMYFLNCILSRNTCLLHKNNK